MSADFPNRQTVRLQGFDYSRNGLYFITICTNNHENLFGQIENGKMVLNDYGKIIENEIFNTTVIRQNIKINQYTIMPNHIHLIIQIQNIKSTHNLGITDNRRSVCNTPLRGLQSPSQTIGAVVRGIKSTVTGRINEIINRKNYKVWQRNYHEHIIRDENSYHKIADYIQNNPSKWQNDKFFRE